MKISKKIWFYVVFPIIFAFNIAVVGTLIYFFLSHRIVIEDIRPEETLLHFRDMREERPEIHAKYRETIRPLNEKNRDLRLKFMSELTKSEPDYEFLQDLNKQIQEITKEISQNFYAEMIETRKTLNPEQARKLYGYHLQMMKRKFNLDAKEAEIGFGYHGNQGMQANPRQGRMRRNYDKYEDD